MMNRSVQQKLLQINQTFYHRFAGSFSATRGRVQPGVNELIKSIPQYSAILDVGCGNGSLARALFASSFQGDYLGVDMSAELLGKAIEFFAEDETNRFHFLQIDLADPDWINHLPDTSYAWLVSFAVLHHLPGTVLRQQIVSAYAKLVTSTSKVAVSVWQWQNSPRLRNRVIPWHKVNLNTDDVDEGDVLLDWRAGDTPGIRYVHTFDEKSLTALAENAGFRVVKSYYSDGKVGNLALYQIWQLTD